MTMVFSFVFLIPLIIIVLIGLSIAAIKAKPVREGGEDVIRNVYIYLVLFATLMMAIGGSVAAFMAAADLISPTPYHQTFEEYKRWGIDKETIEQEGLDEKELRARYDAMVLAEVERQRARAINSLIKSFGWIVIPLPIFIYFQRRLAKARE